MKYLIRGEKIQVTDSIKDYIQEKLSKMDKYLDNPENVEAKILIKIKGVEQRVEVTIQTKGYFLRAEESHSDLYAAIDLIIDKLERQFRKYKTKLLDKSRQENIQDSFDIEEAIEEEIVKRKKIYLKPMDEEEAIMQMELLGHTFFVFKNIETDTICVIYKRHDGNYGLIETN